MSIPTQPTETTIATAAFRQYARRAPTTAEILSVTSEGMEIVKSDIMDRGFNWEFLRSIAYQPITQFLSTYQCPTDYKKLLSVRLMSGTRTGTAQSATTNSITLAAADSGGAETAGKWIVVMSATAGSGQALQCKSYVSATKVATMEGTWPVTPTGTIVYLVVDRFKPLNLETNYARTDLGYPNRQTEPTTVYHIADSSVGDLVLDSSPDLTTYALEILYYADLLKMDTDTGVNPRYATILRLLNGLFIQGIYTWLCQQDSRYSIQRQIYEAKLAKTESQYFYPNNESGMHMTVDY